MGGGRKKEKDSYFKIKSNEEINHWKILHIFGIRRSRQNFPTRLLQVSTLFLDKHTGSMQE